MVESIANILQYLEKKNIYLDRSEFSFQIHSHPAFPSLLSIVSALNVNKISNFAIEIDDSEIDELPDDFMTFIALSEDQQELAYVEKTNGGFLVNEKHTMPENELLSRWNHVVVLIDETQWNSKRKKDKRYPLFFAAVFFLTFLVYIYSQTKLYSFLYLFLSLGGLSLSVLSLRKIFGIENPGLSRVCSGNFTDCSFSGDASKAGFVSYFGDYSLVFFFTNIIGFLFLLPYQDEAIFFAIQKILLIFIIPVIGYSLFFQLFRMKKICPLCLGIIIILLLQTYILLM
ncbi:hypothetical protein B0A69_20695 [Chryseobacterium shigense]|uniref:Uncharacterized membrane protein n=1 Tax=Chryseobacterium shigense TaxID=297244 RepID=A0A1N7IBY5_9FLAO|nr:hypothetical protein B0A69_20695 [Chryseobacterium shigense]SIS34571.1 Uncharacterized membrane protein [Chryseobacterium shigense]